MTRFASFSLLSLSLIVVGCSASADQLLLGHLSQRLEGRCALRASATSNGGDPAALANGQSFLSDHGRQGDIILHGSRVWNSLLGEYVDYLYLCGADGQPDKLGLRVDGTAASEPEVQQAAIAASRARRGKLSETLQAALARAGDEPLDIVVRYRSLSTHIPRFSSFPTLADALAHLATNYQAFVQLNAPRRNALATRIAALGAVLEVPPGAAAIRARLAPSKLAILAADSDVSEIAMASAPSVPQSTGYQYFVTADDMDIVEGYSLLSPPQKAYGVRVGIHENTGACVLRFHHPAFIGQAFTTVNGPAQTCSTEGSPCYCTAGRIAYCHDGHCAEEHTTQVASRIGAIRSSEIRGAAEMLLYQAIGSGIKATKLDALAANQVTVINDSEIHFRDDSIFTATNALVRDHWITVVKAVGNIRPGQDAPDGSDAPDDCIENSICVGSINFATSASYDVDSWKTDPTGYHYVQAGDSRWKDARYGVEKPDVVAPAGSNVFESLATVGASLWEANSSGTSLAAPMVSGLVALMQEEEPALAQWPEINRAIVMVSALRHNGIGNQLSRNAYHLDPGDEKDGAGVPVGTYARQVAHRGLTLTPSWFDSQGNNATQNVWVPSGYTIRAVLSWDYCADDGSSRLSADFDLVLIDSSTGFSLDYSNSFGNSVEMLEWNNTGSGRWVTLRTHLHGSMASCGGVQREYAGLAWAVHNYF